MIPGWASYLVASALAVRVGRRHYDRWAWAQRQRNSSSVSLAFLRTSAWAAALSNFHRGGAGMVIAGVTPGRTYVDIARFEIEAEGLLQAATSGHSVGHHVRARERLRPGCRIRMNLPQN